MFTLQAVLTMNKMEKVNKTDKVVICFYSIEIAML